MMRRPVALLALLVLAIGVLPFMTTAYGPQGTYQIKVNGPSRAVDCERSVGLTATVVNSTTGNRVPKQSVRWSIADGSSRDRLSTRQTKTDDRGRTSVDLYIGLAVGSRRIEAKAANSTGRLTIKVDCVVPTPTPRPTPRATPRPTPRATRRPDRTPRPTPRATATPADTVERPSLTVGYHDADLAGRAPLLVAEARGLYQAAGLEAVASVAAEDGVAGVLDGSLDAALVPLDTAIRAIVAGAPVAIVAAHRNLRPNVIAVRSDITDPAALAGQRIILGADAHADTARTALAEVGFDLAGVDAEIVRPDGDEDAWVEAFLAGEVALTPILNRQRMAVQRGGGTLIVDQQAYGNDVLIASRALLRDAPRSTDALLEAYLGALRLLDDPATDPDLFLAAQEAGIPVGDDVVGGWASDLQDLQPLDGGFGSLDDAGGLGELQSYLLDRFGWIPPLTDAIALAELGRAQASVGLTANPTIEALEPAAGDRFRVGTPGDDLAGRAPLLLAGSLGAVEAAGLGGLELISGAGVASLLDGSVDVAIVTQDVAAAAVDAGEPIVVIAGYQADPATGAATVLVTAADRLERDSVAVAAFLQAMLRGLAALHREDAFEAAVTAGGAAVTAEAEAAWPEVVASFAPYDGSLGAGAPVGGTDLSALRAAQASLGLPVDLDS